MTHPLYPFNSRAIVLYTDIRLTIDLRLTPLWAVCITSLLTGRWFREIV